MFEWLCKEWSRGRERESKPTVFVTAYIFFPCSLFSAVNWCGCGKRVERERERNRGRNGETIDTIFCMHVRKPNRKKGEREKKIRKSIIKYKMKKINVWYLYTISILFKWQFIFLITLWFLSFNSLFPICRVRRIVHWFYFQWFTYAPDE